MHISYDHIKSLIMSFIFKCTNYNIRTTYKEREEKSVRAFFLFKYIIIMPFLPFLDIYFTDLLEIDFHIFTNIKISFNL